MPPLCVPYISDPALESTLIRFVRFCPMEAVTNWKLGIVNKGKYGRALDRIEVVNHNWFYSAKTWELYHHDKGSFDAHS